MKPFLILLCTAAAALAQAPFNATNIRLSAPPVQGTTGSIARIFTLNAQGIGETITPTKNWDAIVATGTVDTSDISGFSALGINLVNDLTTDEMQTTLGATTVGKSFFTTADPSAISFVRVNANNTISYQTAANFRTDIGGTTIGQGYFTLTNPGAITFPRQNANNTVTSRTAVELKTDLTLENVNNTSDANKPVSTAQQTALDLKANLAGAAFTGNVSVAGLISNSGGLKRLAAQFDKNDDSFSDITGLSVTVSAGQTYGFRAVLFTTPDSGGGQKFAISGTATATSVIYSGMFADSSAFAVSSSRSTALGNSVAAVDALTDATTTIEGTIVVNAGGTLTVQFAQNTLNAGNPSSVVAGSYFHVFGF